jgi:hypothetical protein
VLKLVDGQYANKPKAEGVILSSQTREAAVSVTRKHDSFETGS